MANVYYYTKGGTMTLTNNSSAPACQPYVFDIDNPRFKNVEIYVELTDDKFTFPEDASGLFYGCSNEVFNDMDKWDTSECTNMSYLFAECRNLLDTGTYFNPNTFMRETGYFGLYSFNTSNVTDMSYMFENCLSLTDLSSAGYLDTSNVTDMSWMFGVSDWYETTNNMDIIGTRYWDTSNCTNMEGMFCGCINLTTPLEVGHFNTENVTNMGSMFKEAQATVDLSGWNTSNVTDMTGMFSGSNCYTIDISSFDTSNADCTGMFSSTNAEEIILGEFDLSSTAQLEGMFLNCMMLQNVYAAPGTDWLQYDPSNIQKPFSGCTNINNWDGDITLTHANNTKPGGYFGSTGIKNWNRCIVYLKMA